MRLFTAIRPSPAAEEALLAAQAELRRLGRGSFPRREMLHLTLAFLGETADAAAAEAAVEALRGAGPISLTVEGVGQFGDTWWAGVRENPGLERLALGHQADLRRRGFAVEERPWMPHITLARHYRPKGEMPQLSLPPVEMVVREVLLLESLQREGRSVYEVRRAAALYRKTGEGVPLSCFFTANGIAGRYIGRRSGKTAPGCGTPAGDSLPWDGKIPPAAAGPPRCG